MYEYQVDLLRVIDGDTVQCAVRLGMDITVNGTFRLHGLNCPEMNTEAGKKAKAFTQLWFDTHILSVTVNTTKDKKEKYGRYLGRFWSNGECLNARLIQEGFAVPYMS